MIDMDKLNDIFKFGLAVHEHTSPGCFSRGDEGCRRCWQDDEVRRLFMRYYVSLREKASPEFAEERRARFQRLLQSALETTPRLRELDDKKIAELLREGVWGEAELCSPLADLLEAAIDRLERANGGAWQESDDGKIVRGESCI